MKYLLLLICFFTFSLPIYAQKENLSKDEKRVQNEINKKEREEIEKMLKAYTVCRRVKLNLWFLPFAE